jgi:ribonuclease E
MLAAGVDDNGTNLSYTKALEARMSGDDEFEDEEDDADSELYDDDVDSLENEDLDENDDDDDDDSGAPFDEVSSDMRGGSMKIRDKFDDDDDDDETYDDDDDDYPGAR